MISIMQLVNPIRRIDYKTEKFDWRIQKKYRLNQNKTHFIL